jgi:hypothetical protein
LSGLYFRLVAVNFKITIMNEKKLHSILFLIVHLMLFYIPRSTAKFASGFSFLLMGYARCLSQNGRLIPFKKRVLSQDMFKLIKSECSGWTLTNIRRDNFCF